MFTIRDCTAGSGIRARMMFGPLPPGSTLRGFTFTGNGQGAGDVSVGVQVGLFSERPADTDAAFDAGGNKVTDGQCQIAFGSAYIPLNVIIENLRWLVIDCSGGAGDAACSASLDVIPARRA